MFAILNLSGTQFKVQEGQQITINNLNSEVGDKVTFNTVVSIQKESDIKLGSPYIDGASVTAEVIKHRKDRKIWVFKRLRRKNFQRRNGHRQCLTDIKITNITVK